MVRKKKKHSRKIMALLVVILSVLILGGVSANASSVHVEEFFKSPDEVEKILKEGEGDFLIVDIRPPISYEKKAITSSLNIPAVLLKNKTFLKNKKLLVVDEGIDYCTVKKLADELTQNGFFHVYALEGGIRYYQYKNKQIRIIEDGLQERYGLDVVLLQKALHCKDQSPLLIDLREKEAFLQGNIPGSLPFDQGLDTKIEKRDALEKKVDALLAFIKGELQKIQSSGNKKEGKSDILRLSEDTRYPVVLIDSHGEHTPRLVRMCSRRGINTFYLIEGMASWELYTKEIPEARKREYQKKESGCKECNEKRL